MGTFDVNMRFMETPFGLDALIASKPSESTMFYYRLGGSEARDLRREEQLCAESGKVKMFFEVN